MKKRDKRLLFAAGTFGFVVLLATFGAFVVYTKTVAALRAGARIETWRDADGEFSENVVYGPKSWNRLDVYWPKNLESPEARGLILAIHGGSWTTGDRRDENYVVRRCAKRGYVAATIDYMLFDESTRREYSTAAILDEISAAISAVQTEASRRGLELERVALTGNSAGAHLAALYAYSRGARAPLPVGFVATRVGPTDFHSDSWEPSLNSQTVAQIVSLASGRPTSERELLDGRAEERVASISPASFVATGAVPTLAAYGGRDEIVPAAQREKLVAELAKTNVESVCVLYPNSGHALTRDPDCAERYWRLFFEFAEKYLTDAAAEPATEPN